MQVLEQWHMVNAQKSLLFIAIEQVHQRICIILEEQGKVEPSFFYSKSMQILTKNLIFLSKKDTLHELVFHLWPSIIPLFVPITKILYSRLLLLTQQIPLLSVSGALHYLLLHISYFGLPWWLTWSRICLQCRRPGFDPWVWEDPWEKGKATHSSILARRIPWT